MIAAGEIPHTRIGPQTIRIPAAVFDAWLAVLADRAVDSLRLHNDVAPVATGARSTSSTAVGLDPRDDVTEE